MSSQDAAWLSLPTAGAEGLSATGMDRLPMLGTGRSVSGFAAEPRATRGGPWRGGVMAGRSGGIGDALAAMDRSSEASSHESSAVVRGMAMESEEAAWTEWRTVQCLLAALGGSVWAVQVTGRQLLVTKASLNPR